MGGGAGGGSGGAAWSGADPVDWGAVAALGGAGASLGAAALIGAAARRSLSDATAAAAEMAAAAAERAGGVGAVPGAAAGGEGGEGAVPPGKAVFRPVSGEIVWNLGRLPGGSVPPGSRPSAPDPRSRVLRIRLQAAPPGGDARNLPADPGARSAALGREAARLRRALGPLHLSFHVPKYSATGLRIRSLAIERGGGGGGEGNGSSVSGRSGVGVATTNAGGGKPGGPPGWVRYSTRADSFSVSGAGG